MCLSGSDATLGAAIWLGDRGPAAKPLHLPFLSRRLKRSFLGALGAEVCKKSWEAGYYIMYLIYLIRLDEIRETHIL